MIQTVIKRDGRIVGFNEEKIATAIRQITARKAKTRDIFLEIINIKSNDITRENANMNADTPAGMMMKFASETTKPFVDDYLLSEESLQAVQGNYLHIHDKDYYPTKSLTCVQHPMDHILTNGFSAGHGESRPAKRIETASILGCISLETAQNPDRWTAWRAKPGWCSTLSIRRWPACIRPWKRSSTT